MHTEPTVPTYRTQTCRRCKGSGSKSFGVCYGCSGSGVVKVESGRRAMTAEERASWLGFWQVEAYREDRARERAARRAAREA